MKFRYVFEDPRDIKMWLIDYAQIAGNKLIFDDNKDYSRHKIIDVHHYLFTTSDGYDVYEYDYIKICRGDSLKDHVNQVQKGLNGGAVIYHDTLAKLGLSNGLEDATYWMQYSSCIAAKEPNVYFYSSWENYKGE
jgi:hypothetical protein